MDDKNCEHPCDRNEGDGLLRRLEPVILGSVEPFAHDSFTFDELAQLCRIRIYEKREQCRDPRAIRKWARTLCRRVCISAVAAERELDRDIDDEVAVTEIPWANPDIAFEAREKRLRVEAALGRLSSLERRLLDLRYWQGVSAVEIARRVELPAATVRTKLRRARLQLRWAPELVCYAPRRPSLWSVKPDVAPMEGRP